MAATNTGNRSAAEVSGLNSVACALGLNSKAKAADGGAIVCVYRDDDGSIIHIRAAKVGEEGILPDVWYTLDESGNFVAAARAALFLEQTMTRIIDAMPNADYHAHPAISKSGLDKIAKSPAHYKAAATADKADSDTLLFGSAFHDYILLPDVFEEAYTVLPPDFNGRTKDGGSTLDAIRAQGRIALKYEWMEAIEGMAASLAAHPKAAALLSGGKAEQSIFWTDEDTGIQCRCRPDYIHPGGILVDLKTTNDAGAEEFARSVVKYRYHIQDAFYSEGYYRAFGKWPRGFVFVAVEKTAPYAVACYSLDDEAKSYGRELFQRDLQTLLQAEQTQEWQAYSHEIQTLSLPAWAYR